MRGQISWGFIPCFQPSLPWLRHGISPMGGDLSCFALSHNSSPPVEELFFTLTNWASHFGRGGTPCAWLRGQISWGFIPLLSALSAVRAKLVCLSHPIGGDLSCYTLRTIPQSFSYENDSSRSYAKHYCIALKEPYTSNFKYTHLKDPQQAVCSHRVTAFFIDHTR